MYPINTKAEWYQKPFKGIEDVDRAIKFLIKYLVNKPHYSFHEKPLPQFKEPTKMEVEVIPSHEGHKVIVDIAANGEHIEFNSIEGFNKFINTLVKAKGEQI